RSNQAEASEGRRQEEPERRASVPMTDATVEVCLAVEVAEVGALAVLAHVLPPTPLARPSLPGQWLRSVARRPAKAQPRASSVGRGAADRILRVLCERNEEAMPARHEVMLRIERNDDAGGTTDDPQPGYKPDVTGIGTVVAIVPQHEIHARGHRDRPKHPLRCSCR